MAIQDPTKPTRRNKRRELKAAVDRGIIDQDTAQLIRPTRQRRYCPACGKTFVPYHVNHRGFCCGCCAFTWGELWDKDAIDRAMYINDIVVRVIDGVLGKVVEGLSRTEGIIEVETQFYKVTLDDVERIQYIDVKHYPSCVRGRENPFKWAAEVKAKPADVEVDQAEEPS